jgi:sugar phosphate isomerase/epimerase
MTPHLSFAEDLTLFCETGADGIGIAAGLVGYGRVKLRESETDLRLFKASGLQAVFCNPTIPSILPRRSRVAGVLGEGPVDPSVRADTICQDIRRLAAFEPVCCICVPGPQGNYKEDQAREIAITGLKRVARAAREVGTTVAIEPMHSSIKSEFSFLTTIPDAVRLLDEIDEPNTGLLVDIWHLWDTPNLLSHIREFGSRIVGVHLDDWRSPSRSWCDRVLPGDGLADLGGILRALAEGGYDGWFELEVLSDDGTFGNDFPDSLWKLDPLHLIRRGREKFMRAWTDSRTAHSSNAPTDLVK